MNRIRSAAVIAALSLIAGTASADAAWGPGVPVPIHGHHAGSPWEQAPPAPLRCRKGCPSQPVHAVKSVSVPIPSTGAGF